MFDSCANTTNVRTYLEAYPVLRKFPSRPDPVTSDALSPPATNLRMSDLAVVREVLPVVNQAHLTVTLLPPPSIVMGLEVPDLH
jgi:hypothetical protein